MRTEEFWRATEAIIRNYVRMVEKELSERWKNWSLDLSRREMYEVTGALLARQVTLATQLALSPNIWNEHIAPLILRSLVDNYISLAWIFCDPVDRSRKFVLYGLGQEKLQVEHLKARLKTENEDPEEHPEVKYREGWIDAQQYTFLTEVNVGSWSGIDARTMAEQAECIDFYNYSFQTFTSATHNMWNHVGKYNLVICPNPLHKYHAMPAVRPLPPNIYFVLEAALYTEKAFALFDEKTSNTTKPISAYQKFRQTLNEFGDSLPKHSKNDEDRSESTRPILYSRKQFLISHPTFITFNGILIYGQKLAISWMGDNRGVNFLQPAIFNRKHVVTNNTSFVVKAPNTTLQK